MWFYFVGMLRSSEPSWAHGQAFPCLYAVSHFRCQFPTSQSSRKQTFRTLGIAQCKGIRYRNCF